MSAHSSDGRTGPSTPRVGPSEEVDLADSLVALSNLSVGLGLKDLLVQVAAFAVHAIPGADGAGLTLAEPDRADIVVKSADFVREIEDIQYSLGEGPCISAAESGATMRSGSLGGDPRWPHFGPRVGRLGVHSALSLPLITPIGTVGALNVYAHHKDVFDEGAEQVGEVFAEPAAIAVYNAQILAQAERLADQAHRAMTNRAVIDQAIGIIRSRRGFTAEEAFDRLRTISQTEHTKLSTVAASIVNEAVQRAHQNHRR